MSEEGSCIVNVITYILLVLVGLGSYEMFCLRKTNKSITTTQESSAIPETNGSIQETTIT